MEFHSKHESHITKEELREHILILPSVSYGNLGQLAIDLILNTLLNHDQCIEDCETRHVGYLISPSTPPLAGGYAYTKKNTSCCSNITVNLELYQVPSKKLLIFQQRTPIISNKMMEYATEVVQWACAIAMKGIYVIAGASDLFHLPVAPTRKRQFGVVLSSKRFAEMPSQYCNPNFLKKFQIMTEDSQDSAEAFRKRWKDIRGTGVAPFLDKESSRVNMPFATLVMTCTEGCNVPEAVDFAAFVWSFIQLPGLQHRNAEMEDHHDITENAHRFFILPPSWSQMFGKESNSSLYF